MGGLASAAGYVAAALALAAGIHIAAGARAGQRTPSRTYLAVALCAIAIALTLAAPLTLAATVRLAPIPNAIRLLGDAIAMLASWCVLAMLAHAVGRPATATRRTAVAAGVLVACVAAMTVLLVGARTRPTIEFATDNADNVPAVAYEALYVGYMCWGMISFIWLIRRHVGRGGNRPMRVSLRVNMAAAGVGLAWAAWKVANVAIIAVTKRSVADQAGISELLAAAVVGLVAVGVMLPSWSSRVARIRARRDYRALAPLWEMVTAEVPQVLLPGKAPDDGIEYALYRRVIEIRDAQRVLRPYIDPTLAVQLAEFVEHLNPVRANLVIEASELAAALAAHRAGRRYDVDVPDLGIPRQGTTADVHAEARWLARIARALRDDQRFDLLADRTPRQSADPGRR